MHEASIAESLMDLVRDSRARSGWSVLNSLKIRVGRLSGVMPDALMFAFEAMKPGTIAERATLIILESDAGGECGACGGEFTFDAPYILECPLCGSGDFTVTRGRELELLEMEVD